MFNCILINKFFMDLIKKNIYKSEIIHIHFEEFYWP